jgi:hypothetical protein
VRNTGNLARRLAFWPVGSLLALAFASMAGGPALGGMALLTFVVILFSLRGPARAALAGGAGTALGALFLFFTQQAIEHCAQFNRQPGGSCSMGDSTPYVLVATVYVALGLALSYAAATRAGRSAKGA